MLCVTFIVAPSLSGIQRDSRCAQRVATWRLPLVYAGNAYIAVTLYLDQLTKLALSYEPTSNFCESPSLFFLLPNRC